MRKHIGLQHKCLHIGWLGCNANVCLGILGNVYNLRYLDKMCIGLILGDR